MMEVLETLDFSSLPDESFLMLAEGNSETGFLFRTGRTLNVQNAFVANVRGENNLPTALKSVSAYRARLRAVGLMFDANANATVRLNQIKGYLTSAGFLLDEAQKSDGGIYSGPPKVGIFLSPGNGAGRIENLVIQEIMTKDFWPCMEDWKNCASQYPSVAALDDKSIVQMAISALQGDVCGIGTAFKRAVLDVQHVAYAAVHAMVQELAAQV